MTDHVSVEPKVTTLTPVLMAIEDLRRTATYPEIVELSDALGKVMVDLAVTEFRFPNLVVSDDDEVAFRSWCSTKNITIHSDPLDCKYILTRQDNG